MGLTNEARTTSMFRFFSVGVVAANKERNSEYVEVTPLEQLPMLDGELTQSAQEYEARSSDATGQAYEEKAAITASIRAKWRSIGHSNRMTPPDVRRGEEVMIYQFSDADEYFWDTFNNHVGIRKLETVVWAYSGTKDESKINPTPDDCYVIQLSTHDKYIRITTSKADGEPFKYDIHLNTKDGHFDLMDDAGNRFFLDSPTRHLRMENGDGSHLEILGKTGSWHCDDSIKITTKDMQVFTTNIHVKGERLHEGNSIHDGNLGIIGGLTGSAGHGDEGGAVFNGGIRTKLDVIAGGISLMHHKHKGCTAGDTGTPF